jgi:hypothetical protein
MLFVMMVFLVSCSGKGGGASGMPNEADAQKAVEKAWAHVKWQRVEKVDLQQNEIGGMQIYVFKFKAAGVCLQSGPGCQKEGDKVELRNGVLWYEKSDAGWQPGSPRADLTRP